MASTGVLTGTNFLEVGDGTVYTNAVNAEVLDGVFATVALAASGTAEGLAIYTYGATVPAGATVVGIEVPITAKSSVNATSFVEATLIKSFAGISFTETTSNFTTSNATYTLGGPSDLWGTSVTPSDVNDATFGIVMYASTGSAATVSIDAGQINIYYTLPGVPNSLMMMSVGI